MKIILYLHILGGFIALAAGTIALLAKKGSRPHRLSGKFFFYAMLVSLSASLLLAVDRQNLFLLMVGIFSLYPTIAGYRALFFLRDPELRPGKWDYLLTLISFMACVIGSVICIREGNTPGLIFGGAGIFFSLRDIFHYYRLRSRPTRPALWLVKHLGMMGTAYISALTAFLVVNSGAKFGLLAWLLPPLAGAPLIAYYSRRYLKPTRKKLSTALPFLILAVASATMQAQPYVEDSESRFRFAQSTAGLELQYIPGSQNGLVPRISIGGIHFRGHADFSLSIPVAGIRSSDDPISFSTGVETGVKLFPWRIEKGRPAPYAGFDWGIGTIYCTEFPDAPELVQHMISPNAGIVYDSEAGLFTLGLSYNPIGEFDYPLPDNSVRRLVLPRFHARIGYRRSFETTLPAEEFAKSGQEQKVESALAEKGRLNNFYLAAGFSSAFVPGGAEFAGRSDHYRLSVPPALFPEFGLGYYHHGLDAALNCSFRSIAHTQAGYGVGQSWSRTVLSLELLKFLFDYNGFVPFAGIACGPGKREYAETGSPAVSELRWDPAFVFGWDIRPNRLQFFTIRTTLRWTPQENLPAAGKEIGFNHFEFNFFQLVLYPGRLFG